jgi:myo-inositol 2-dehydrogenase/D-chiro-inositol 1-dehydrogenase
LLGEVTGVQCHLVDAGSAVAVHLTMRTASGALSVSELGSGPGLTYDVGAELVGSTGVLRTGAPGTVTRAVGERAAAYPPSDWLTRFDAAYLAQAVAWLRSLRVEEPAEAGASGAAGAQDGWANAVVVEAALDALPAGRRS